MNTTHEKSTTSLNRILSIGTTLLAGLILGILSVLAIQNFSPSNERPVPDVAQNEVHQTLTKNTDDVSTSIAKEIEQFQSTIDQMSVFDRQLTLYTSLSSTKEQELRDWWSQSQTIERLSHRETVQNAILRKLATINPYAALDYIGEVSNFQVEAMLMSLFSEWSISKLNDAIEAANTLSSPRRRVALRAILKTRDDLTETRRHEIAIQLEEEDTFRKFVSDLQASQSIEEPWESWEILINDEIDDYLQTESLAMVVEEWREQVGFEVLSNLYQAEIDNDQIKRQLVLAIAQVDLAGALDYTRELTENEQLYLSRIIAREWALADAQAALIAVSTFEPDSLALRLENDVVTIWARTRPNEAIEHIESISEDFRIGTLEGAFSQIASEDPMEAITKLSTAEQYVGNTSSIALRIVYQWSSQNAEAAADWVVGNYDEEDPVRRTLLEEVLLQFASQDPNKAFDLAIAQPVPSEGIGLEYVVMGVITQENNVDLAMKLLPRVHESSKPFIYGSVATALVREGRTKDALELGTEMKENQHRFFYSRVFREWAKSKPKDLFESLADMTTDELKSQAAMQLILSNRTKPVLTDEQVEQARSLLSSDDEVRLNNY